MQAIPTIRKIRRKPRPLTRHAGRIGRQTEVSPGLTGADGFLNYAFLPLCHKSSKLPKRKSTEKDFFQSASELCRLHGFEPMDVSEFVFPYNVLLCYRDIKKKLNRRLVDADLYILKTKGERQIALATRQVFDIRQTLYYVPVIPLFRFLKIKQNRACGELLLAVMSYLYREAGIPYYRNEYGFLYEEYDMNKQYLLECAGEIGEDSFEERIKDVSRNDVCGDMMQRKIHSGYHLAHLPETIRRFKPKNALEQECLLIAKDALQLYRDHPGNYIFQHVENPGDEDDEVACPETFVGFIGDYMGWCYHYVEQSVNDQLGNYPDIAVPLRFQVFDGSATEAGTLEFEYRLFGLLNDLCNILQELP